MLDKACNTKVDLSIEPALSSSDLSTYTEGIGKLSEGSFTAGNQAHFAAIETACRNIFYGLLVRIPSRSSWELLTRKGMYHN